MTYVSFSKVTDADLSESAAPDAGVIDRFVIFPQKEKKSWRIVRHDGLLSCSIHIP